MYDLKKRLLDLLEKDAWTAEEIQWMVAYLEESKGVELETLMQQQFNQSDSRLLSNEVSRQILDKIHEHLDIETGRNRTSVIRLWTRRVAIAASIIVVVGLGWRLLFNHKMESHKVVEAGKQVENVEFVARHVANTSGVEKRLQLPDGSLIVLANQSEISYSEPFVDSRNLTLTGKAYFKVIHDAARPFVVTAGELTTTDLGTEFTVTAFKNSHRIIVRLYEGRVVVKAVDKSNKKMKRDIYLLPGQEFVYGAQMTAKVNKFKAVNAAPEQILKVEVAADNPLLPKQVDAPWFMFNNQSLESVLTDLSALYNVEIVYDKKDIQNIYFTGKYNKSESLANILERIATLNNLTITKKDSAYIISK